METPVLNIRLEIEKAEKALGPNPHCDGQCKKQEKQRGFISSRSRSVPARPWQTWSES